MPPTPAFNALAALYSLGNIVEHAARHRAATVARATGTALHNAQAASNSRTGPSPMDSSPAQSGAEAHAPPSKAERRRIQRQQEDEEFNSILGKRWVNGVWVDGSLPFNLVESIEKISYSQGSPPEKSQAEFKPPTPEPVEALSPSKVAPQPTPVPPTQPKSRPVVPDSETQPLQKTVAELDEIARQAEEAIHDIEKERELEKQREPMPEIVREEVEQKQPHTVGLPESTPTSTSTPSLATPAAPTPTTVPKKTLQASKVPSSRIGRLFHYGGLAASLGYGAAAELLRGSDTTNTTGNVMLSEANIKRLVGKLTQMRGAALKLGQFMSIQDTHLLPPELDQIFRRVQDSAHYMPDWQMEKVMTTCYGPNWFDPANPQETIFTEFERVPFAAASIGQVHRARLAPRFCPPHMAGADGLDVAVKVQFPNIGNSIQSDLGYVKMLLSIGGLLPKGLFLDRTIEVMSAELVDECSYTREASFLQKFRSKELLGGDDRFKVPWVWEGSTDQVLVMERVGGVAVGDVSHRSVVVDPLVEDSGEELAEESVKGLSQRDRDDIAARIIELCLKELFEFRTMQTDPNWTNFLWNKDTRQIELVDFGATRTYSKKFMDSWLRLLQSAANDDRAACIAESIKLGYLTGAEDEVMLDAHVTSMTLLATPFKSTTSQPFAFGPGSQWTAITKEIRTFIPVMVSKRLTPPPQETYSLNRKLSGAFLLAARLDAKVDTKEIWDRITGSYEFGGYEEEVDEVLARDVD